MYFLMNAGIRQVFCGGVCALACVAVADPSADPDGDGRTNLQELRDGSDPTVFDGARRGVNVRVFGAVGDGVHDDTAALQRAADSVAMDGRPGHERAWMCTRNISNTMSDSPCTELYFPPGTYRITGPVAFNFNTTLRGENATIANATTNEVSFYFEQALRIDIEGLSFAGGATHVRHWSNNRDTATCLIRNCTFRGASDVAFVTDAYREETGVRYRSRAEEMAAGVNRRTCSAMVLSRDGDRVRLVPRDPKTFVPWENSTNFILDGCRFLGNGRAVDIRSDGCVIRNCRFVAPSGASRAQVELGVRAHLYGCEIGYRAPRASAAVVCHSGNFGFEDCRIGSDAPLAAVRYLDPPAPGYNASSLTVRNFRLSKAVSPLLSFAEGAFPNKVTADGVTGSAGEAFGFDRVPSRDDLAAWLRGRRHPDLGPALSYGISLSRLGEMADNLPDVFVRYRHDIPVSVWKDVAWPSASASASGRRMEFGGETVVVSNTIVLADGMRVIGRGRALLKAADDSFPVFRVPKGAKVRIENVSVWRGRHAVEVEGDGGVEAVNCAFYDQLGATFRAPAGTVRTFGGIAYTPFLYDGAGLAFFEALWFSCLPDHPDKDYRNRDYAAIRVGEGGRLFVRDLLGVPCYFRHVMPMHDIWRKRPAADQVGDFRWIDSRGEVVLQHCRFGGEWGGLTPVYQRGAAAKTYLEGPYFCVDCPRLRDSRAVMRIDSPSDPVLVDSVTTLYNGTYADRAHCVFPFRHEERKSGK